MTLKDEACLDGWGLSNEVHTLCRTVPVLEGISVTERKILFKIGANFVKSSMPKNAPLLRELGSL